MSLCRVGVATDDEIAALEVGDLGPPRLVVIGLCDGGLGGPRGVRRMTDKHWSECARRFLHEREPFNGALAALQVGRSVVASTWSDGGVTPRASRISPQT